ncbi:ImmA/IrrE family metallo-endopeptidase [Sanguibacter antarcticus]|uniref:Zn-dependent peptidase ImmA (M78 family) n=1 Tax=Sanguibacter antarcticus TaxID=372484 RepID=A0A2A9E633_9MICO|nr:ImmA/IrrE family metallo-endopeptidase [Sanguibacter antarcticus]PFG33649.1 Zn-dependent peptidase ImmA (M78 family) [Sanguibacter antarcticus]
MSNERIGQSAAAAFRGEFGLGTEPIVNMARLIEQKTGVGVAYVNTSMPGHGMTMRFGDRYLMAVGCTEHPMRLRSTLAHELGHFRIGSVDRTLDHSEWDERTPQEIQADAFARHLLIPLEAARAAVQGLAPTTALLSDLVQKYKASPNIVAIQLRDAKAIDQETCQDWSALSAGRLASQFGWHAEYASLTLESNTPRGPQALLARAVEGYRWGLVTPATIARLDGQRDPDRITAQLEAAGIVPLLEAEDAARERPTAVGTPLTPEELALLMGDAD